MHKWNSFALVMLLVLGTVLPVTAQTLKEPPIAKTWKESKVALNQLAEKFRDPKLSKDKKVELLPASNNLLFDTQQLKLTSAEKQEQIQVIVSFIAATIEADFANSNTDSVYDHFKANKKAYLAEISKIKNKKIKDDVLEAFEDWAKLEKSDKNPEEEEGGTVPEVKH